MSSAGWSRCSGVHIKLGDRVACVVRGSERVVMLELLRRLYHDEMREGSETTEERGLLVRARTAELESPHMVGALLDLPLREGLRMLLVRSCGRPIECLIPSSSCWLGSWCSPMEAKGYASVSNMGSTY